MMPTDETSGGISQLDALLPPEMACRAEQVGAQKAGMDAITVFTLAVLPGAFIALRGVFAIDPGSARERLLDRALPDGE